MTQSGAKRHVEQQSTEQQKAVIFKYSHKCSCICYFFPNKLQVCINACNTCIKGANYVTLSLDIIFWGIMAVNSSKIQTSHTLWKCSIQNTGVCVGGQPLNPMRSPGNTSPMQIGLTMKHFKERVQREKLQLLVYPARTKLCQINLIDATWRWQHHSKDVVLKNDYCGPSFLQSSFMRTVFTAKKMFLSLNDIQDAGIV